MLFGRKYLSKALSSVLLVALLLIHSVRLLHSHSNDGFCSKGIHDNTVVKNSSDCSVCNYQLAKDTDAYNSLDYETSVPVHLIIGQQLVSCNKASFVSAFESRGPPPVI
jgi:hypothetical protein